MQIKLRAGNYMIPVEMTEDGNRLVFSFGYNKILLEEIKMMEGAKWHGYDPNPRKVWSVPKIERNLFQLDYLQGNNPYEPYDRELISVTSKRNLYKHQLAMKAHGLTRHYCIISAEMGTGKSLAAIEIMEDSGWTDWYWVAPKSALYSVRLELEKWNSKVMPNLVTYEGLKKIVENWPEGMPAPMGVIFDEQSRVKNPTAQRSQAAAHLARAIRTEHGPNGYVIGMSGSPAPKAPTDWWNQTEIVRPGFLKEGNLAKCKARLALIKQEDSIAGGQYQKIISWRDSELKCGICGQLAEHTNHLTELMVDYPDNHGFIPMANEVNKLYERLKGLVLVQFKKDCLDLPDKIYKVIKCQPSLSTLNAARLLQVSGKSAIDILVRMRELSDGFQYVDEVQGTETCPECKGNKFYLFEGEQRACSVCNGIGTKSKVIRTTREIPCPKDQALIDLLDEHADVGRIVIYGGFTGTIDRIVNICTKATWKTIRVDGRGWQSPVADKPEDMIKEFQSGDEPRIAFIGHPGSAGMGLTLTASPTIVYFSNDFNAESRIQSEDRIHRPGMDVQRGATIIDLLHLPSDKLVLDNLKKKRDLQSMTLGQLAGALDASSGDRD